MSVARPRFPMEKSRAFFQSARRYEVDPNAGADADRNKNPVALQEELIETLLSTPEVRIERIVSLGHSSPEGFWYDQEQNEWILLVQGAARLR